MASTREGNASSDATFILGPFDSIEHVDDAACALLGYSRLELLAMHGSDLIPVERQGRTAVSLDLMRRGEISDREGVLRRKDGVVLSVAVEAQVLGNGRLRLKVRERPALRS